MDYNKTFGVAVTLYTVNDAESLKYISIYIYIYFIYIYI